MIRWPRCLVASLLLVLIWPVHAKAPDRNDVRVLIDISGSMRQNDPRNLRRPALRMLVGLLQPGTRAGVWTFAKWTNPLVPVAEVDEAWKKRALKLSQQIRSPGMFTDIERILQDATQGWSGAPETHNRHLVLLTDGMVDVSKDAAESAASRKRILDSLLSKLKRLGVRVHTIALSERADHELMKQLSGETGGLYQQVEDASQLKRVFLKVFEQVGKPEGVPLKDNRFTVDASINEATILLFRKEGSPAPVLISPDGTRYSDTDVVAGVAWYRDEGYDLITLNSPVRGEWSLQADVDPDNRVMIVTDLKLQTSELPAHLATGEPLPISANLSSKGKQVRRKVFLRLLDMRADAIPPAGTGPLGMNDQGRDADRTAGDGIYSARYQEQRALDEVELLVSVESPTFMREKRYWLAVHEPATLRVEGKADQAKAIVQVEGAVMADGARIEVWQSAGKTRTPLQQQEGAYPLVDPSLPVFMKIEGMSRLGNLISREIGPVYSEGMQPAAAPAQEPLSGDQPSAGREATPVQEVVAEEPASAPAADKQTDWGVPVLIFAAANLLMIGVGLGIWRFIRKGRQTGTEVSLEDDVRALELDAAEAGGGVSSDSPDSLLGDETTVIERQEGRAA